MKRSALFALLASLSLAVGCQDSQVTNPVDSLTNSPGLSKDPLTPNLVDSPSSAQEPQVPNLPDSPSSAQDPQAPDLVDSPSSAQEPQVPDLVDSPSSAQEPQAPDLVDSPSSVLTMSVAAQTPSNVIILDADIPMGNTANTSQFAHVSGKAKYSVALEPIMVNDMYRVTLALSATLAPLGNAAAKTWSFSGESVDRVIFNGISPSLTLQPSASLTKTYVASDEGHTIVLTIVYRVTKTSVSIQDMWCNKYFK